MDGADSVIVTLEDAQDGHVIQGVGGGIKMVGNRKVLSFVVYRKQMLYEMGPKSTLGLTKVQEPTLGATDTVDQVGGCTGEPLPDMKCLLWALNG
eukprot:g33651.t1